MLNIVNEKGEIIGQDTREKIHLKGLLHKEVHVWFYLPNKDIIFQLRGKDKDTFPNLLDATVGGHVELGSNFIETALKEMIEETGVRATKKDLHFITTLHRKDVDPVTGMINNVIREVYAYEYKDPINKLMIEEGESEGFEAWPISKLAGNLSDEEKRRFISSMLEEEYIAIFKAIGQIS